MIVKISLSESKVERLKEIHKKMGVVYVAWIVAGITGCTMTEGLRIARAIEEGCE